MKTASLVFAVLMTCSLHGQEPLAPHKESAVDQDRLAEYHLCIASGRTPSLERFRRANAEVEDFLIAHPPQAHDGLPALNTKCVIAPQRIGYAVIWLRASFEPAPNATTRKKVDEIISAALFGPEPTEKEGANQTPQRTPGEAPSSLSESDPRRR